MTEAIDEGYGTRILRSSAARLAASVAALGVSFVMMPFVLRTLGDHDYGLWVIAASFESYYYFLDLGLNLAASRYVSARLASGDESGVNEAVSTAYFIFLGLGIAVAVATLVIAALAPSFVSAADAGVVRVLLLLAGLTVAIGFPVHAYAGIVYGQMRHDLIEVATIVRRLVEGVLIYFALSHGFGLTGYAVIVAASNLIGTAYFYRTARRLWPSLSVTWGAVNRPLAKELFTYSTWTTLSHLADMVRFRIDALVIGAILGASAVARYNVGYRMAEMSGGLVSRATNFMTPLFTRYFAAGATELMTQRLVLLTRANSYLALTSCFVLVLIGRRFLEVWVGDAYADAYPVMVILLAGRLFEATTTPLTNVIFATANLRFYAFLNLTEAIANVALSLILVSRIGILGVAIGTTVPMVVSRMLVMPYYVCRMLNLPLRLYYGAVAPSAIVTAVVLALASAAVSLSIGAAGYLQLAGIAIAAAAVNTAAHYALTLTAAERTWFLSTVKARLASIAG